MVFLEFSESIHRKNPQAFLYSQFNEFLLPQTQPYNAFTSIQNNMNTKICFHIFCASFKSRRNFFSLNFRLNSYALRANALYNNISENESWTEEACEVQSVQIIPAWALTAIFQTFTYGFSVYIDANHFPRDNLREKHRNFVQFLFVSIVLKAQVESFAKIPFIICIQVQKLKN